MGCRAPLLENKGKECQINFLFLHSLFAFPSLIMSSNFSYEKITKFFAIGKEKKKKHGAGIVEVIQTAQASVGEKYTEFMKPTDIPGMTRW